MNAINLWKKLFGPDNGTVSVLLNSIDHTQDYWRLQQIYDTRFMETPYWEFIEWPEKEYGTVGKSTPLKEDEIYGFLKGRYPHINWHDVIKEEVKDRVKELLKDLK